MTDPAPSSAQGYAAILARQCRIAPAERAALIRIVPEGRVDLLAIHPGTALGPTPPAWILTAAKHTLSNGSAPAARFLPPQTALEGGHALVPIAADQGMHVWAVYEFSHPPADPAVVLDRLTLSAAGLGFVEAQAELARQAGEIDRLRRTLAALMGLASHDRFASVAMALCNHVASEWKCERVSLGIAKGPDIRVEAISHTENLAPRSTLVRDIESVMEECLDQDAEITVPAEDSSTLIARASREFASRLGPLALCSIPVRRDGEPFAVITLERPAGAPFTLPEVAALRLLADSASAHIWLAHRYRRWIGATLAASTRALVAAALGPAHAWAKLTAVALAVATLFFLLVPGAYRVRGDARIEATDRRVIAGPFDGYLIETRVRAGDPVNAGDIVARLDASDLLLRLAALRAEHDTALREAALAQRERKDAEAQIARARARRAEAEIALIDRQISQAAIASPLSGTIIAGNLDRALGSPVRTGDVLFEVAPLDSMHIEVFVAEDQIADVAAGAHGALTALSRPDRAIPLTVVRIDPVADVRAGRNVFRVVASLDERPAWLRPGMEGTARIDAGRRSYPWIWTRRAVNWLRMKLWI